LPQWFAFTNALADLGGKLGRVSRLCQFNFFLFVVSRLREPRGRSTFRFFVTRQKPFEHSADRPLDGVGVIALEPVQETAGNHPIDIGIADLNHEAPEPALAPVA
jgi:hypothetical protein